MSLTEQQNRVRHLGDRTDVYRRTMREDEDRTDVSPHDRWWDRFPWGVAILFAIVVAVALNDSNLIVAIFGVLATVIAAVWSEQAGRREKRRWHGRRAQFLNAAHDFALEQRDFDLAVRAALRERYGVDLPSVAIDGKTYTVNAPQGVVRVWYASGAPGELMLGDVELATVGGDAYSDALRSARKFAERVRVSSIGMPEPERSAVLALDDEVTRLRSARHRD